MRQVLAISFLISSCLALAPAGAVPHGKIGVNYGGRCASEDAIYVEGNKWWWFEIKGREIPGECTLEGMQHE